MGQVCPSASTNKETVASDGLCILSLVLNHAKDIEKMLQKYVTFG